MINKRYGDFLPCLQGSEELMVQVNAVSKEMEALKNCIENEVYINILRQVLFNMYLQQFQVFLKNLGVFICGYRCSRICMWLLPNIQN